MPISPCGAWRPIASVVSLGEILNSLHGPRLDEGWRLYLATGLVDQLALNFRNEIAHATRATFTQFDAAVLLHICSWLAGLTVTERTDAG